MKLLHCHKKVLFKIELNVWSRLLGTLFTFDYPAKLDDSPAMILANFQTLLNRNKTSEIDKMKQCLYHHQLKRNIFMILINLKCSNDVVIWYH